MPEMDGFQFLKKLKSDEMFSDIPTIVVSALQSPEKRKQAEKLGALKYIVKTEFSQKEFLETVISILMENQYQ